jgi:hypothetical protein
LLIGQSSLDDLNLRLKEAQRWIVKPDPLCFTGGDMKKNLGKNLPQVNWFLEWNPRKM